MSSELAAWLRQQREDRGWTRFQLARQLIRAARAKGATRRCPAPINVTHNIYRCGTRRRGSGRPLQALLLRCLRDPVQPVRYLAAGGHGRPWPAERAAPAYRGLPSSDLAPPGSGASAIRREVLMAAHEASEDAERAEQRGIGEATLEHVPRRRCTNLCRPVQLTGETYRAVHGDAAGQEYRVLEALGRRQNGRVRRGRASTCWRAASPRPGRPRPANLGYPQACRGTRPGPAGAYATIITTTVR